VDLAAPMAVQIDLEIVGTEQVAVVPVAAATLFKLSSNWPHPSFGGDFLPVDRTITTKGFAAQWRVSSLASSAQQDVALGRVLCTTSNPAQTSSETSGGARSAECLETVSVAFIDPVNTYVLSDRATKYGVLFIALTFVAVGLFEFMCALRVHPIQYLLVGAAISLFFLLLLSLSEHLPFSIAYATAAAACVLLLGYYASYMLHSWRRGLPFGLGMATLYGLLYLLLQLEQTALIVGSLALFALLALIMTLTRRVDWYARLRLPQAELPEQPA
jgi:inner membrane protein